MPIAVNKIPINVINFLLILLCIDNYPFCFLKNNSGKHNREHDCYDKIISHFKLNLAVYPITENGLKKFIFSEKYELTAYRHPLFNIPENSGSVN
ncbi:hypothetical protein LAM01_06060 [Amylolactobacillus amylophilus]|nr:hypothetical protein LAM01_06060 [Amylolactobacillus amylophilus]